MRSFWFLTLLPLVACESVESKDIGTDAMSAQIEVISADGASTRVHTTLRVGGLTSNTYVELTGDDQLTADDGSGAIEMSYLSIGDYWTYIADFSVAAADTPFTVALVRSLDGGAPASTASLTAPFALTAPAEATVFSRASDPITVTWDSSGTDDSMVVRLSSDCTLSATQEVAGDPGTYTFEVGSYEVADGSEAESCEGTLTVERRRAGVLDEAFGEGGEVYAAHRREVKIRLDP